MAPKLSEATIARLKGIKVKPLAARMKASQAYRRGLMKRFREIEPTVEIQGAGAVLKVKYPFMSREPVELRGKRWIPKEETHVTLIGFGHKLDKKIKDATGMSNKDAKEKAKQIINGVLEGMANDGIKFRVLPVIPMRRVPWRPQIITKASEAGEQSTIIHHVNVTGMNEFYDRVDRALSDLGHQGGIERSPAHITLFTEEGGKPIGITTWEDLRGYTPSTLNPTEHKLVKGPMGV